MWQLIQVLPQAQDSTTMVRIQTEVQYNNGVQWRTISMHTFGHPRPEGPWLLGGAGGHPGAHDKGQSPLNGVDVSVFLEIRINCPT